MLPYYLLLLLVTVGGYFISERVHSRKLEFAYVFGLTAIMIAMAWMRAPSVGFDTKAYIIFFNKVVEYDFPFLFLPANGYRDEMGYALTNYLISRLTSSPTAAMGIISALIIGLRGVAIFRKSTNVWMSMFVYVSFGFFSYAMCTLRQELGISVLLFALPYLQQKKFIPYLLITLLAGTFHLSIYFMIPVYFIANIKPGWKPMAIYGTGTVLLLLFTEPLLDFVTQFIFKGYKPGTYFTEGRDLNTAFIPLMLFLVAMLMKKRLLERDPKNVVYINFLAYASFLFIITIKHFIFQRFALILLPAALFLVPEILNSMRPDPSKLAELERLKAGAKTPQQSVALLGLKAELRDAQTWYRATIGFILFGGTVYLMFLLNLNRLGVVPYVTVFG